MGWWHRDLHGTRRRWLTEMGYRGAENTIRAYEGLFEHMRCGENFGTTYGELPAVPKSLVGENKDDTKHEVRRVHTPMQNLFLELTVKMWIYCFLRKQ